MDTNEAMTKHERRMPKEWQNVEPGGRGERSAASSKWRPFCLSFGFRHFINIHLTGAHARASLRATF
jgi:hypothetical protein